jgi:putative transposase
MMSKGSSCYHVDGLLKELSAWLYRYRRLSKDYEVLPESSEAFIYIAMIILRLVKFAENEAGIIAARQESSSPQKR